MKTQCYPPSAKLPTLFATVVLSVLLLPVALRAQVTDPYQSHLPDSLKRPFLFDTIQDWASLCAREGIVISVDGPNDSAAIISPEQRSAAWLFEMLYDSTATEPIRIWNTFTDFRRNTTNVIWLDGWRAYQQVDSLESGPLSAISVTKPFPIGPGDTISFFREFTWFDESTGFRGLNNYRCEDTLSYSVEMLDVSGGRIALLDTITVLRQDTLGVPKIRGDWQIARKVSYVVPMGMSSPVRLRMNVRTRGDGDWFFNRKAISTSYATRRLLDPVYAGFIQDIQQRQ